MEDTAYFIVGLVITVGLLLAGVLLVRRMIGLLLPLRVNAEATGFEGSRHRQWTLSRITGRVMAAAVTTHTFGGIVSDGNSTRGRIRTNVHDTIRLQLADGGQQDVRLINFYVSPQPNDVITVCYANSGEKWITIAVLNHTTNQQFINDANLFRLLEPRAVLYVVLASILVAIISVSSGLVLFVPALALLVLYFLRKKRVRRNFARPGRESGIVALWDKSAPEAMALM